MLFMETVAAYCENHTEHTDTVRTSQETHNISATETNRLCCLGKQSLFTVRTIQNIDTVRTYQETHYIVYCENHTEHIYSPYLTRNTLRLRYRDQPVNAV
jgi:hypothetical protein